MSFGTYARMVRDTSLPYGRRVSALRSCVQLYRPIGFHATLGFLEEIAGPYQRDEAELVRALVALTASREAWQADVREYAALRRDAKRRGQRSPRPVDRNPSNFPLHWYGAPRRAALHALNVWERREASGALDRQDQVAADLRACVRACLGANGALSPEQRQVLTECIRHLEDRRSPDLWRDDQAAYFRTWDLLKAARLAETAADADSARDRPAKR